MPGGLNVSVEVDSATTEKLETYRATDVPDYRRRVTRGVMREVLRRTIIRHPVDTGRSRSAWSAALKQLGGTPPPGPVGHSPEAIAEGARLAEVSETETATHTELRAANGVSYVPVLEYGGRSQAGRRMVRRSLDEVRTRLPEVVADA